MKLTFVLEVLVFLVLIAYVASMPMDSESRAVKDLKKGIKAKQEVPLVTSPKPPKKPDSEEDSDESDEDDDYDDEDDDDDEFDDVLDIFGDDDSDDSDEAPAPVVPVGQKQVIKQQNQASNEENDTDEVYDDDDEYEDDDADDDSDILLFDDYILEDEEPSSDNRPIRKQSVNVKQNQRPNIVVYKKATTTKTNKSTKNKKPASAIQPNFLHTSALLDLLAQTKKPEVALVTVTVPPVTAPPAPILNEKLNDETVKEPTTTTTATTTTTSTTTATTTTTSTTTAPTTTTTTPAAETSSVTETVKDVTSNLPVLLMSPPKNSFSTEINKILSNLNKPVKKHYTKVPLIEASNMDNKQPTVVEHIKIENPTTTEPELPILLTEASSDVEPLPILLDNDSKTDVDMPSKLENFLIENMHILKPADSIEIDSTALPVLLDTSGNMIDDSSTTKTEQVFLQKDEKVVVTTIKSIDDDLSEEDFEDESTTLGKAEEAHTIEQNDLENEIEQITDKSS